MSTCDGGYSSSRGLAMAMLIALAGAAASPALADVTRAQPVGKEPTPEQLAEMWRPHAATAAELQLRNSIPDPRRDGALILSQIDFTVPRAPEATPNYYFYRGAAVPMKLMSGRLAVRFDKKVVEADRAALVAALGVPAKEVINLGLADHALIELAQPLAGEADANARIEALLVSPLIQFAAPVFQAPLDRELFMFPTQNVLARFSDTAIPAAVARATTPELALLPGSWGNFSGGAQLAAASRNGFEVMRSANRLSADRRVLFAEPDFHQQLRLHQVPNDPLYGSQWGLHNTGFPGIDIGAQSAYDITFGNGNVKVLVMDVGTQQNHPDINQFAGRDFTTGVVGGIAGGGPATYCEMHGTSTAGIITAFSNNGLGVCGAAGGAACYGTRIAVQSYPASACSGSFSSFNTSWFANAIVWGQGQGCRVSNASVGFGGPAAAVDTAYTNAYNAGMVHCASAGNGGVGSISYPSSSPDVLSIASIDVNGARSSFSQYGPGLQFAAPGRDIYTTDRTGADGYNSGGDYVSNFTGTSAASPMAAGAIALVMSAFPLASAPVTEVLMRTGGHDLGAAGYDTGYGWGIPNAYTSMTVFNANYDNCGSAKAITANAYTDNQNTERTVSTRLEPHQACTGADSNSVFYSYTASVYGVASISTAGSSYDTVLAVFDGCGSYNAIADSWNQPNQLACNDDFNGTLQSNISGLALTPGQSIIIKVAKFGTFYPAGGNLTFNFNFVPTVPANDACANAIALGFGAVTATGFTYSATPDGGTGNCGSSDNTADVWYTMTTSQCGGTYSIDTFGSSYDTVLGVYTGCPSAGGTRIACNDDYASPQRWSQVDVALAANTTYWIRVSGFAGLVGNYTLNVRPPFSPNNTCATAAVVGNGTFAFDNSCSLTNGLTTTGCVNPNFDLWYAYHPGCTGTATVTTCGGSTLDTVLLAYTGCPSATDSAIACNDDFCGVQSSISFPVVPSATYYIRLGSYWNYITGSGTINFSCAGAAACSVADIVSIGGLPPPDGLLTGDDFNAFISAFAANDSLADIVSIGGLPPPDGLVTGDDFNAFIAAFAAGCP